MSEEWIIRPETDKDYDAIDAVIISASSGEQEAAEIVRKLRSDGDALLSLVAVIGSRVIGHIMISRMCIETAQGAVTAVALAPLMVDPDYQNRGVGRRLTWRALSECRDNGERIVFVLGHPTYYPRFGFSADLVRDLHIPFKLSVPDAFMALELTSGALADVRGRVKYARAFGLPPEWTCDLNTGSARRHCNPGGGHDP